MNKKKEEIKYEDLVMKIVSYQANKDFLFSENIEKNLNKCEEIKNTYIFAVNRGYKMTSADNSLINLCHEKVAEYVKKKH